MAAPELPGLPALWCEDHPDDLRCLQCRQPLGRDALVRTIRVHSSDVKLEPSTSSRVLKAFGKQVALFDRHLSCMAEVNYVTISHVWDPQVSDVQNQGYHPHFADDDAIAWSVLSSTTSIYDSLESEAGAGIEMWYDYLSVPQWHRRLKSKILSVIPRIFQQARFTLVYMEDVTAETLHRLRHGKSLEERVSGITGICNAKWFSRVWTTMEFVRASSLRVMTHAYAIQADVDDVFLGEMYRKWEEAVKEKGEIHDLEGEVAKMGKNKVPWNLGHPERARQVRKEGKHLDFGHAFSLLSRRGCRSSEDFFYALLGLVGTNMDSPPSEDPDEACLIIQKACLAAGDMSPLLVTPRNGPGLNSWLVQLQGYHDAATFDLGARTRDPLHGVEFTVATGRPLLTMNKIGSICWIQRAPHMGHQAWERNLWQHIYHVMDLTGPDVEQFATTLGVRLFQMSQTTVDALLGDEERRTRLSKLLTDWYDYDMDNFSDQHPPHSWATEIGNLMYILQRPPQDRSGKLPQIQHVYALGGTVHGDMRFQGTLVGATCETCCRTFMYRAAVYTKRSEAFGAVAYRIPGLCYSPSATSPDGVGLLVKGGKIIGRLLWATPACDCPATVEKISVSLNTLARPV